MAMQLTFFLPAGSCTWIFCPSDTQKTSPYFPNHHTNHHRHQKD